MCVHGTWERGSNSGIDVEAKMSSLLEPNSSEREIFDSESL